MNNTIKVNDPPLSITAQNAVLDQWYVDGEGILHYCDGKNLIYFTEKHICSYDKSGYSFALYPVPDGEIEVTIKA